MGRVAVLQVANDGGVGLDGGGDAGSLFCRQLSEFGFVGLITVWSSGNKGDHESHDNNNDD